MSKSMLGFLVVAGAVLLNAGNASAQVCVNTGTSCNSYFFALSTTGQSNIFALNGFEFGCGQSRTRHASGVLRAVTGRLEIEFTGTNENFDFTQSVSWSGEVASPGLAGSYKVLYTYINGGVFTAHGATGPITVTGCSQPTAPTTGAADTSQP